MLLDPAGSWALLVGTGSYTDSTDLANIPAVRNNLRDLKDVLTDPAIGRMRPDQCTIIEDPDDQHQVADALDRVASWSADTLIFYYAGHGLIDDSPVGRLHLGLAHTTQRLVLANSLPYSVVQRMIGHSSATTRVVILDCCFSGLALSSTMSDRAPKDLEQLVPVEGSYVLTSSASTRTSMAPAGARYTAFTGHLLKILREGVPGGPHDLDLETIYLHTKRALADQGLPEPQRLVSNTAHYLSLVLNQAWVTNSDQFASTDARSDADRVATTVSSVVSVGRERGTEPEARGAAPGARASSTGVADQTSTPTAWRRWIVLELRRLRLAARLSQSEVASSLGLPVRRVSLIENGQREVLEEDLLPLLRILGVPEDRWPLYVAPTQRSKRPNWWEEYGQHTVPAWLELFVGLEQGAERIRAYQPAVIHGLLQTPAYARLILKERCGEEKLTRLVDLRIQRQAFLWRKTNAPQLWVIMDEAALMHVMQDPDTMRQQIDHVVTVTRRLPNITVQIVPFDRSGAESAFGGFTLLTFPFPNDPGTVYLEHVRPAFLETYPEVDAYSLLFQQISTRALSPEESLEMLEKYANDL